MAKHKQERKRFLEMAEYFATKMFGALLGVIHTQTTIFNKIRASRNQNLISEATKRTAPKQSGAVILSSFK